MKSRPMLKNIINETDPELFKKKKIRIFLFGKHNISQAEHIKNKYFLLAKFVLLHKGCNMSYTPNAFLSSNHTTFSPRGET